MSGFNFCASPESTQLTFAARGARVFVVGNSLVPYLQPQFGKQFGELGELLRGCVTWSLRKVRWLLSASWRLAGSLDLDLILLAFSSTASRFRLFDALSL